MTSTAPKAVTTCSLGTRHAHTAYRPVALGVPGPATSDFELFNSLCLQDKFGHFSHEELRLADYETGLVFDAAPTSALARKRGPFAKVSSKMMNTGSANQGLPRLSDEDSSFISTREFDVRFAQSEKMECRCFPRRFTEIHRFAFPL
jgi:hypothetical protein